MQQLQHAVRQALTQGDHTQLGTLGEELRRAQRAWEVLCGLDSNPTRDQQPTPATPEPPRDNLPLRDQVHQALTLLTVPASPKLLSQVHQAFFSTPLNTARLTTLRRDEERSFRSAPYARPYYICSTLTSDLLAPARALLALSTWSLERRIVGPLTQRVHFLTAALRLTDAAERLSGEAELPQSVQLLLLRYSQNIHGYDNRSGTLDLTALRQAAATELDIHADEDAATCAAAAQRAREQLGDAEQNFGSTLRVVSRRHRTA
ncbi:hypothetical protein [Streptomyces sp. NRRL F-5193]|uniref:hypothetical protein n=1 Tax=Streptomyces sp. NRRL F-5193 TaxID=1463860 RepID=UPI001F25DA4C|nr:hypothetical protein [Streptomyces sp. NRRL F-5193]